VRRPLADSDRPLGFERKVDRRAVRGIVGVTCTLDHMSPEGDGERASASAEWNERGAEA
jgi:hypothetical protein